MDDFPKPSFSIKIGFFDENLGPICLNSNLKGWCEFYDIRCNRITSDIIMEALSVENDVVIFMEKKRNLNIDSQFQVIKIKILDKTSRGDYLNYSIVIKMNKGTYYLKDELVLQIREDFISSINDIDNNAQDEYASKFCEKWEKILSNAHYISDLEKFRDFLFQSNDGFVEMELKSPISIHLPKKKILSYLNSENLNIVECNDAYARLCGYKDKIALKENFQHFQNVAEPTNKNTLTDLFAAFVETRFNLTNYEFEFFDINGKQHYIISNYWGVIENDLLIGMWTLNKDITAIKNYEKTLSENKDIFEIIDEQNLIGISVMQDGGIVYCNKYFAKMIERSVSEVYSLPPKTIAENIHPDHRALVLQQIRLKLSGDTSSSLPNYEFKLTTKFKNIRWVRIYSLPITFKNKPAIYQMVIDITDKKLQEIQKKE